MPKPLRLILPVIAILAFIALALPASASNMQSPLRQETPTETAVVETATTEPTAAATETATIEATAAATETATLEITSAATETATVEVTATTGAPIELLENGSFENEDDNGKPLLDPWVHVGNPGEKVKCNKNNKVFSYTGDCGFRFKGNPAKSGVVKQTVDLTGHSVGAGDTLTLSLWINGKTEAAGKGKVKVKFANGEKDKGSAAFTNTNEAWVQVTGDVVLEIDGITAVTVQLKHAGKAGKFLVDDVSLLLTEGIAPTATATVDLTGTPAATETTPPLLPLP